MGPLFFYPGLHPLPVDPSSTNQDSVARMTLSIPVPPTDWETNNKGFMT